MREARAAGEVDALSAFGLAHGTPKPPPTWAQRWLSAEGSPSRKVTIPSVSQESLKKKPTPASANKVKL
jgi:hypothetical protein